MKLISNAGNLFGSNQLNENNPEYIINALNMGYDVKIDVWLDKNQNIYLGSDEPKYLIEKNFIIDNIKKLWVHCKNIESLYMFLEKIPSANFFWQEFDYFSLTSKKYIWTYPGKMITPFSIMVYLDTLPIGWEKDNGVYGICSNNIGKILITKENK
jgi:hypothetical protein